MNKYAKRIAIKAWAEDDRPREKLLNKGREVLSEAELIAILLGSGNAQESAVELAKRILNHVDNSLVELGRVEAKELMRYRGVGEAKAVSIAAALELGRRRKEHESRNREKITCSQDVVDLFGHRLDDIAHEEFWMISVNRANKVIQKNRISSGGINTTVADAKIIFKYALEQMASAIFLCHNHPSGNVQPSRADVHLTLKMKEAGKLLDIQVLDHIIIGDNQFYSFADQGRL